MRRAWPGRGRHRDRFLIHRAKSREQPGALVAIVDLVDCVPLADVAGEPFAEGPWCWVLTNVGRIKPIPWRGRQKLFDVPWPQ
jgi:hypothetical protein